MKHLTFALLLFGCLASQAMALDSAQERLSHPSFNTVPPPSPLPPGKAPGTFCLSAKCTVDFSQQSDFPATIVLLDYAKKELFRQTVTSSKPFALNYDLKPGTYEAISKPSTDSKYWEATGFGVHIDAHGALTYIDGHSFESPTFWHVRKIEIISPNNLETITAKPVPPLKGDDTDKYIEGKDVVLRWKAIPGVKNYTVRIWAMQNPFHPDSFGGEYSGFTAKINELHFPKGQWFRQEFGYAWVVTDGRDDLNEPMDGHIARGRSIFLTPGAQQFFQSQADHAVDGDIWINTRMGVRLSQGQGHADDPTLYVLIEAIGADSPAVKAGLIPGTRIFSVNNTPVSTLDDLRAVLGKIPPGTTTNVVVGDYKLKQTFRLRVN